MQKMASLLLAVSLCLLTARAAPAQKFQPKSIQFIGAPEYAIQELLDAAELKKGTVLNYAEMNDHSKKLMDTGMFATLAFKFDGQDLIFSLTPSDTLLKARFDNIPLGTEKEINDALHKQLPLYHGMVPSEGGICDAVRATLQQMLAARGLQASITAVPTGDPTHRGPATVESFAITAPRVLVGPITVAGASPQWKTKVDGIAAATATGTFDASHSEENVGHNFLQFYQDRGYAAARVTAARVGDATASADAIHVPFAVTIEEGRQYKIGSVQLPAGTPITKPEVDKLLADRPGAPEDGIRLRGLWLEVGQRFKSKGYLDCKVTPKPQFDDAAGKVNYTVEIEPGPVYHLAFVKFEGVSDQLRALLIKNWQMMPGDPFDENYAASFITNIQQHDPVLQRTFAGVGTRFNAVADQQTHDVNVTIRLSK